MYFPVEHTLDPSSPRQLEGPHQRDGKGPEARNKPEGACAEDRGPALPFDLHGLGFHKWDSSWYPFQRSRGPVTAFAHQLAGRVSNKGETTFIHTEGISYAFCYPSCLPRFILYLVGISMLNVLP